MNPQNYQSGNYGGSNVSPEEQQQGYSGLNWDSLSDKDAKTLDNFELGKVKQVTNDYIYIEKGVIKKEKFFVPKRFADRFDGKILWFAITSVQAETEFRREVPPGPGEYAKRYTTVEKKIIEKTIETGPGGERREKVEEKTE
jgi:hypothetical protein